MAERKSILQEYVEQNGTAGLNQKYVNQALANGGGFGATAVGVNKNGDNGYIPVKQPKTPNPLGDVAGYLAGDQHDSKTTASYLSQVEDAMGNTNSETEWLQLDDWRKKLEVQARTDAKYERRQNNPIIKAWNYVTTPREKSEVEKLENQRDLAHYAYMGTLDPKYLTEEQEANARALALKGEISEPDRHRGQIETIPKVGETGPKNAGAAATAPYLQSPEQRANYAKKIAGMSNDELIKEYNEKKDYDLMYSGYATDLVSEMNFSPAKEQLEDVAAEVAKRGINPNPKKEKDPVQEGINRLQAEYNQAAYAWNGTHDPKYKEAMEEANAKIRALKGEVSESGRARGGKLEQFGVSEEMEQQRNAYAELAREAEANAGYATDPLSIEAIQPLLDEREAQKEAIKSANKAAGLPVYEGLAEGDQWSDAANSWAGGRAAGTTAAVGAVAGGIDANIGYADDAERLLNQEYIVAHAKAIASGDPDDWAEAERLEAELHALQEENKGKSHSAVGDVAGMLLDSAKGMQETANQQWEDVTADMSENEKLAANVFKTGMDVVADLAENSVVPGLGTMRMYLSAGGNAALEQMDRENNDPNSLLVATLKSSAAAYLSTRLVGGMESVYGKSILGQLTDDLMSNAAPEVQAVVKTLLNTEGVEEGLEDILNVVGDRIFKLQEDAQIEWDEVRSDAAIGYILGVLTNGLAAGISYDSEARARIAEEAIEFAMSGMSIDEAMQIARQSTMDQVVMTPHNEQNVFDEVGGGGGGEGPDDFDVSAQQNANVNENVNTPVTATLEEGRGGQWIVSTSDGKTMVFNDLEEAEAVYNQYAPPAEPEAEAAPAPAENEPQAPPVSPERETIRNILERGSVSAREAARIRNNPALAAAFEQETGTSLAGLGEKAAAEAINRAVTTRKHVVDYERSIADENGNIPYAAPTFEEGNRDYNKAQAAASAVSNMLGGDTLTTKDASKIVTDKVMWAAFGEAIGIDTENIAPTVKNAQELYREAKKNGTVNNEPDAVDLLLGTEPEEEQQAPARENTGSKPKYGEPGWVNPMGEDIEETGEETLPTAYQERPQPTTRADEETPTVANAIEPGTQTGYQGDTNTPPNTENADSGGLTAPEQNAGQSTENQQGRSRPTASTPATTRAKISQYFTNTMTQNGTALGLDPNDFTYNPTSEIESLTNAAMRLAEDQPGMVEKLMNSPAWDNEMMDAAYLIAGELNKERARTGDSKPLEIWMKLIQTKTTATAKGLQAVAKQSRPNSGSVLIAALNKLAEFREGGENAGRVSAKDVQKAENAIEKVSLDMAKIEANIDEQVEGGVSESEAVASAKNLYLDLAEEINRIRGTGKMFGSNKNFRKMLANQDMDFIQRFVACQAAGIAEDVEYKGRGDVGKKINTLQKLAQLTGTGTWGRNLTGNASFGLIDLLSNNSPITLVADALLGKKTGMRSTGLERGTLERGTMTAVRRAAERSILEVAANIDLAEDTSNTKYDLSRTRTFDPNGNIVQRFLSRWEQWNGYMLTSSDAAFRGGIENSVRNAIIRANGWDANNLSAEQESQIRETARQVADYRLFQNQGIAAGMANDARSLFNRLGFGGKGATHEGGFGLGTAIQPYTTVPTNIGVKALEFSPAGAVKGLAEMIRVGRNSNATMAQQNQAVTDLGRGVTGTALIVGLAQLMKNAPFFKDWEDEEDKDIKAQNKAEGKSGMQFNIDMMLRAADGDDDPTWRNTDRTVDISSIEPLNQIITAASLLSQEEGITPYNFGKADIQAAKESFMDLPSVSALKNIEDNIRYTNTPDDVVETAINTAASTAGGVVGGFIPAPVRHIASVTDEYQRDTSGNNAGERAINQVKSGLPWLRETLPVKTDAFGNEVTQGDTGTRLANTYLPFKHSQVNQGEASREIERLYNETGVSLMPDRNGPSSVKINGEKTKLTAAERKAWKDDRGRDIDRFIRMAAGQKDYQAVDADTQIEIGKTLEEYATSRVMSAFAKEHGQEYKGDYDYVSELENPITWLTTRRAFDYSAKQGNYDAIDALMPSISRMNASDREELLDRDNLLESFYKMLTPNAEGYKVDSAETVQSVKEGRKEFADARGVKQASAIDTLSELIDGYNARRYSPQDVDAYMSAQDSDGDWSMSKTRAAIYLSLRKEYPNWDVGDILRIVQMADKNGNGIKEGPVRVRGEYEASGAVKQYGGDMNEFQRIYYGNK